MIRVSIKICISFLAASVVASTVYAQNDTYDGPLAFAARCQVVGQDVSSYIYRDGPLGAFSNNEFKPYEAKLWVPVLTKDDGSNSFVLRVTGQDTWIFAVQDVSPILSETFFAFSGLYQMPAMDGRASTISVALHRHFQNDWSGQMSITAAGANDTLTGTSHLKCVGNANIDYIETAAK